MTRRLFARLLPARFIRSHGWRTAFIDDGFGPSGWYAYTGPEHEPELETGIFDTEADAARVALETWPDLFAPNLNP